MITEATTIQWVEKQLFWLDDFSMRLEVNQLKGERIMQKDAPMISLVLSHFSGQYSRMDIHAHDHWPESRLQAVLWEMIKQLIYNRRVTMERMYRHASPWANIQHEELEDYTRN